MSATDDNLLDPFAMARGDSIPALFAKWTQLRTEAEEFETAGKIDDFYAKDTEADELLADICQIPAGDVRDFSIKAFLVAYCETYQNRTNEDEHSAKLPADIRLNMIAVDALKWFLADAVRFAPELASLVPAQEEEAQ